MEVLKWFLFDISIAIANFNDAMRTKQSILSQIAVQIKSTNNSKKGCLGQLCFEGANSHDQSIKIRCIFNSVPIAVNLFTLGHAMVFMKKSRLLRHNRYPRLIEDFH